MLILFPQKRDFQLRIQHSAFGERERAGCAVLKIPLIIVFTHHDRLQQQSKQYKNEREKLFPTAGYI